jgi:hypothetical protein
MEYPYPQDFPKESRAAVHAEKLRASKDLSETKTRLRWTSDIETELRKYILRVFIVFAREALNLGRKRVWTVDKVESQAREFLRWFIIYAWYEKGYDEAGNRIASVTDHWGSVSSNVQQALEQSPEWVQYEAGLLEVAEIQSIGDLDLETELTGEASLPAEEQAKSEIAPIQFVDVEEIKARRLFLLAEYKAATEYPSNKRLYEAKNSGIHKPQFYQWLDGTPPASSATTTNFERFLREKKPPIPRRPKH